MEALTIESVAQIHQILGKEPPRNPLITLIDNHLDAPVEPLVLNVSIVSQLYAISLKNGSECGITYGRRSYDFQAGSLMFLAPGQTVTPVSAPDDTSPDEPSWTLIFHPDLIRGSALADEMRGYRFFDYAIHEALHVSTDERRILCDTVENIRRECQREADDFSRELITTNLALLLGYCKRFYARQFDTRAQADEGVVIRFEAFLRDYVESGRLARDGMPSVQTCARELGLSPNYLSDLLRKATGVSTRHHVHAAVLEKAKDLLLGSEQSIAEIAYALGFEYPQHFSKLFKSKTGMAPSEFRG
ncbi:MAG: AraC family transcriptional regulator [Myxococcales bacterium]|nr:AraC family transcriptional regulator [Myxococcales bacterium]